MGGGSLVVCASPVVTSKLSQVRQPPVRTQRFGKGKRQKGPDSAVKLPKVVPSTRCKLKQLKMERIKDHLLLEVCPPEKRTCRTG